MECLFANDRILETAAVLCGSATASGMRTANHLSPAYFWQNASSVRSSPARSSFVSFENAVRRDIGGMIQHAGAGGTLFLRFDQCPCLLRLVFRHLHEDS